ncbi:PREDICTED: protein COBRA-like [Nicotiana attenuata]|uniref:COBRA-like protein n=1 Tax=Nicotiana attenuata TaxID=49451 RepID=A0A314KQZ7_NICAT|nr:PREDICTED: protein COBRA-like [Nicotiana attenuata]OIT31692.1 protein cobra [Nicotiana attenuata]
MKFFRSLSKFNASVLLMFLLSFLCFSSTDAYDALDPNGNITIKWDVMSWTPDGYVAVVTMYNFQQYRHIQPPGWTLRWTWAKDEVIWNMIGSRTIEQGNCSKFKGDIPHCCKKNPTVVDLLPETPHNQQIANCCKGGVLNSWGKDPATAVTLFQLNVGSAGTNNNTVRVPKNFTLQAPGPGYTCGPAKIVKPTKFVTPDGRRVTQAMMTWNVTCAYAQFLAEKNPKCCVSLSSSYNDTIVPCPTCACGCENNGTKPGTCVNPETPHLSSIVSDHGKKNFTPLVQCTDHMCPVGIRWHVKLNYKDYWRVKITITNFNYHMNYTQWNLVVQHPNLDNITQLFSINYKSLIPDGVINDTAMFWGVKSDDDLLMQPGPLGNVQFELLLRKDTSNFTSDKGWAFPNRVYFNGDNCAMPPPDAYPHLSNDVSVMPPPDADPHLPNAVCQWKISLLKLLVTLLSSMAFFFAYI